MNNVRARLGKHRDIPFILAFRRGIDEDKATTFRQIKRGNLPNMEKMDAKTIGDTWFMGI
jgi:hypothetical protein